MVDKLIQVLVQSGARRAVKYINSKEVLRITRKTYSRCGPFSKNPLELLITHGRPNYRERQFIKTLQSAKEPFPVKKVQLQFLKEK